MVIKNRLETINFESFVFSGGEPHIKINTNFDSSLPVTVIQRINSFNDLGLLCVAVDALKRIGADLHTLEIPYFPGARQDRAMVVGEPLTVKVYADIINNFGFRRVVIYDPHSDVTPALINNCVVESNYEFIHDIIDTYINDIDNLVLISPDGGALKKIYKISDGFEVIECSKVRDVKTGKLSGFKVNADDLTGKNCLIVDDICDGGGTFIGLATELKKKNANKLYLAVSHGIFSKGVDELNKYFTQIFTTDSITKQYESIITYRCV